MASRHVHGAAEKRALEIRLRKVIGQLKSVEEMVHDNRDCVDILTQVVSARKALKSFAEVIIHQHAHECIARAANPRDSQKKLRDLLVVLERYVE
jgi:DNA-binding FrmR family transcriptional regulator